MCTNDRATGTTAYPDIYVNVARKLGLRESCRIDIETWDDKNHKLGDTTTDCALGHHTANPVKPGSAATVHTFARLWFDGGSYWTGDSAPISLAPNANGNQFYDWDWSVVASKPIGHGGVYREPVKSTAAKALQELHHCLNCSFPVPGAPSAFPANGQTLSLHGLPWPWPTNWYAGPAIFSTNSDGFTIVARDGHQDGASATVTFRFYTDGNGYLHLHTTAVGVNPPNWWSPGWANKLAANTLWGTFAVNLGTNLLAHGEGTPI